MYDKVNHTYEFEDEIFVMLYIFEYEDIPSIFKRLITYKAAGRAAAQLVTNTSLVQLLQLQEQLEHHVWNMNVIRVITT